LNLRRHEDTSHPTTTDERTTAVPAESRGAVVDREREEHGGVKIGSAFFGWLAAMGMAVLLTALAAAAGVALGLSTDGGDVGAETVGLAGGIALLVILFVSYYCGGYVAGRMARFDGLKQGLAVWLWAIVVAVVVAVLALVAGSEYDVLDELDGFPRLPSDGDLTTAGVVVLVLVLAASLVGAVLGGLAGMRFHRRVDRTGLGR
jgi:hypothetical protein